MTTITNTTSTRDALTKKQAKKFIGKRGKRVAIAKDVLKQLKAKKYVAKSTYFEMIGHPRRIDWHYNKHTWNASQLQSEMRKVKKCNVCAIGAALTSGVMLYGDVSGADFDPNDGLSGDAAKSFFTQRELSTMEAIFEIRDVQDDNEGFHQDIPWERGLMDKVREGTTHDQRMKCIFKSIASNKGRVNRADMFKRVKRLLKKTSV